MCELGHSSAPNAFLHAGLNSDGDGAWAPSTQPAGAITSLTAVIRFVRFRAGARRKADVGDPARNFVRRWERHRARQVFYQLPGPMPHLARE